MSDPLLGQVLGNKYKVMELIGHGGMANVYKAYFQEKQRYVAVKVMHSFLVHEQDFLPRFKREAKAMAMLKHPRIVKIYDFNVHNKSTYYLVMQYVSGGTLKQRLEATLAAGKFLPSKDIIRVGAQIADAIAYAHFHGIVHRDIKSGNIMLDEDGKVYLTDFGIVKLVGGQSSMIYTTTGALIGSPAYMSPEQALGKPGDERSDIYSLGVLLFQIATGKLPFESDTALGVVLKHVNEKPPAPRQFNRDLPKDLEKVILRAMEKDPQERYQAAGEVVEALRLVDISLDTPTIAADEGVSFPFQETAVPITPSPPITTTPTAPTIPTPPARTEPVSAPTHSHPSWLKETEIICPNCEASIDVRNHGEQVACTNCHQIYKLTGHMCPYCHTYHKEQNTFCRECGEMMVRVCHNCRTHNWGGDDNCKNCGTPLDLLELLQSRTQKDPAENLEEEIEQARRKKEQAAQEAIERTIAVYQHQQDRKRQARYRRIRQTIQEILFFLIALASIAAIAYYAFNNWLS